MKLKTVAYTPRFIFVKVIEINSDTTMKKLWIVAFLTGLLGSCQTEQANTMKKTTAKDTAACNDACCSKEGEGGEKVIACKLTSPELQKRKATVLADLQKQVTKKKELDNGYEFTFAGSDEMIDKLTEFIKTERQCCDFFTFGLSIDGDLKETRLSITGPEGAKEFIETELEL